MTDITIDTARIHEKPELTAQWLMNLDRLSF